MNSEIEFNTAGSMYSTASTATAEWKRTQEHTFTRWVNQHLAKVNKSIQSLRTDLADGLALIALLEVLSGKKFPKHQARPVLRSHKIDNVSLALRFLEESERIRVVNIDAADIVDCKLKLILGLIWHLILHYSISKPNHVENHKDDDGVESNCSAGSSLAAQQRLLAWLQARLPTVPLSNFTTDWNDGRYLGYLVHSFDPTLCSDWYTWNPRNGKGNVRRAMDAAEEHLGIAQLIDPDDVASRDLDEPSMMTYLAQFRNAKVVSVKMAEQPPTEPPPPPPPTPSSSSYREVPKKGDDKDKDNDMIVKTVRPKSKCKAFGEGLIFGTAGEPNRFMVDTRSAAAAAGIASRRQRQGYDGGSAVRLGLAVEGPSETQLTCTDNHDGFWTIDYKPDEPGDYTISVKLNDEHVEGSPFKAFVGAPVDNNKGAVTNCNCKHCQSATSGPAVGNKVRTGKGQKKSKARQSSGGANKGQPFSVSILGRNSPQYAVDKGEGNNDYKNSTIQTVTFEENVEPSDNRQTRDAKPAPGSATHEVSVTTTIDLGNGKTNSKVMHKDTKGLKHKQMHDTKESPTRVQAKDAVPANDTNIRQYPPIPQEWLPRAPPAGWNAWTGYQYPPTQQVWIPNGGGRGANANGESRYRDEDDEYDGDMEIYTNTSQPKHKNKVVVHICPCKECRARRSRSKVVVWTNDRDGEDDGHYDTAGNGRTRAQRDDRDQPYRETIVSSTIEIHNPQDGCHIM